MKYLFRSRGLEQLIKNLFIFLPLIFGKRLFSFPYNLKSVLAFFVFSIAAWTVYTLNDIFDIEKDRSHPAKRSRPIASGKVSIKDAWIGSALLGILSLTLAFVLDTGFGLVVLVYISFNILYSKVLKEVVIIDVFCVGFFFLLRVTAGSIVAKVEMSHWIIIMTVLLALFLGFNKRRQELSLSEQNADLQRPVLAKYTTYFIDQAVAVLTSSIVVVYMLYTLDARTLNEFGTKNLLYSVPFVYYGIFRYLYLIHKPNAHEDPAKILVSDKKMQVNLVLWAVVCIAVIYFGS